MEDGMFPLAGGKKKSNENVVDEALRAHLLTGLMVGLIIGLMIG